MNYPLLDILGSILFGCAVVHTFSVKKFQQLARKYPEGSLGENFFHLFGEVEVVFGIWAAMFIISIALITGPQSAISYVQGRNFTEPMFVFVIMAVCSTKPIIEFTNLLISFMAKLIPGPKEFGFYITSLTFGCWLGSFITEPAAMTVVALLLYKRFYSAGISLRFKYATLGLLFVNISIGGTLTPFAAPPVLMVAAKWDWDFVFMASNLGWKGMLASALSTLVVAYKFRNELKVVEEKKKAKISIPKWVYVIHLLFLGMIVITAHYPELFIGIFLFFIGLFTVTKEYQDILKLKSGMLVGFFLAGLVVLGGPQQWWLEPLIRKLDALPLYTGAMLLTAITDNAALTYLGSLVPDMRDTSKYALVAGAVVGGGLTVIANAPNPAGFGILNPAFGEEGISPIKLFINALFPTLIAALCFWFL